VQYLYKFNLFFDMKTVYVGEVRFEIGMGEILLYTVEAKFSAKERVGMIKPLFSGWVRFGGEFKNYIFDNVEFENEKLDGGRAIFLEKTDRNAVIERAVSLKERMQNEICGFVEEVKVYGERENADAVIEKMRSEIEAAE
jgi:hypothetical protein